MIVRSGSIPEDGFGNAFAGKYESVFCANTGDMAERPTAFERAIRTVYASTVSLSALGKPMKLLLTSSADRCQFSKRLIDAVSDAVFLCAVNLGLPVPCRLHYLIHDEKGGACLSVLSGQRSL